MNWLLFISGILTVVCIIGHLTMGTKSYLKPMLNAEFDNVSKKVFHSLFHYMTAFFILTAIILTYSAFSLQACGMDLYAPLKLIAILYMLFAIIQFIIGITSGIKGWPTKLFQWTLFLLIGILAYGGTCMCGR